MVMTYLRRAYSNFAAYVFDVPPRLMAFLFLLLLVSLPVAGISSTYLSALIYASIIAIFAMSWDLLGGRTGQISLGHALFFGLGGYTTALLFKFYGLPTIVTIPAALLVGALVSLLIGFPCLRVKGPYLALVTMAFPLIVSSVVKWSPLTPVTGGEFGVRLPAFFPSFPIAQQRIAEYYLALLLFFAAAVIMYKIANSKTGIVFVSILDDEVASKACGINVTKQKLIAFVISGVFASLAGCLQAHILKIVNPPMFDLSLSFAVVIVTYLGGIGTIYGPIVGAYIYVLLDRILLSQATLNQILGWFGLEVPRNFEFAKLLIFVLIVLVLVIKWPRGIARFTTDRLEDLEEARDLDERGKRIWKRYKSKKTD